MHNVKWLRSHYGLSKKDMAEILGIGVTNLNQIEKGIYPKRLSTEIIARIYYSFGIFPEDLMGKKLDE